MSEIKSTPGPWRIEEGMYYACIRTDAGVIADMRTVGSTVPNMGNTHLIAAAPDLLQELQNIANADTVEWDDPSEFEAWAKSRARHAIAKATGSES